MSGLPYYPRYPKDFFEGTAGMPLDLKGPYGLLIDLIMMRGEMGLPDDPHFISGHLGCSVRKWNSIKSKLIAAGKIYADLGIISNKRADKQKIIQRKYRDNQSENARIPSKNNDLREPPPTDREDYRLQSLKEEANASSNCAKPKRDAGPPFSEFWEAWGLLGGKIGKAGAESAWKKIGAGERRIAIDRAPSWFSQWRQAYPTASPIHASTYLNRKRFNDETAPQGGPANGRPDHNHPKRSGKSALTDRCIDRAARREAARSGARPEHARPGDLDGGEDHHPSQPLLHARDGRADIRGRDGRMAG